MATDGPDPEPCNPEVFEHGDPIFMTHGIPSNAMEQWVKKVAKESGQRVDWHFAGGRAVVLFLGDREAVRDAITVHLPEHDALYRKAFAKSGMEPPFDVEHYFF